VKDDPTDRRPEETCFFPVFDDVYDLQEAKVACMERGGVLAILKNPNKVFKQFIRKQDNFKTLAGMWIDATYLGNGVIRYGDGSTSDLKGSWRFLYPMSQRFRTGIVYSVWSMFVTEADVLEGYKNISPRGNYNALCQLG